MKSYELTYIISSGLTTDEVANVMKETESFIQSKEGVILSSEKTAAQTLAYPIKKQSSGYFSTVIFQLEEGNVKELKAKLDLQKEILRSVILVKKPAKIMKERRTRKPMAASEMNAMTPAKEKKSQEKLNPEDLDKKLDEILK